jgi:hypothetical protein
MYYNIELAWEPEVIGVKNGIYQLELDKEALIPNHYTYIESLFISGVLAANEYPPEVNFKIIFKKLKSARMTSFMSFSPYFNNCHFLVHKKVIKLFNNFNIQRHKYFEVTINDSFEKDGNNEYRLFYMSPMDWGVIDYDRTVFTDGGFGNVPRIDHSFKNETERRKFMGITKVKRLALLKDFDFSLDIFHTRIGGLFISEKLKIELEANNVTGVNYRSDVLVIK